MIILLFSLCIAIGVSESAPGKTTLYAPDSSGSRVYFPVSQTITWIPLIPQEIVCDYPSRTPVLLGSHSIIGRMPILKDTNSINGYVCSKVQLSTSCDTGFFGGKTIAHLERHLKITASECIDAVEKSLKGDLEDINYPLPDCSWMKMTEEENVVIHVARLSLLYDPYKNEVKSELFPGGSCRNHYCQTVYESKIWVPDQLHRPQCASSQLDPSVFYIKVYSPTQAEFWSPDMHIKTGDKMCTMDYCGMGGFRFSDGSWIGVDQSDIPRNSSELGEFLYNVPECSKDITLTRYETHHTEHLAEQTLIEKFFYKECMATKEKLLAKSHISRIELQSLNPISPGYHRVYRINNGSIEMGMSEYREGVLIAPVQEHPIVFTTQGGIQQEWKYWTHDPVQNIFDGPNGLYVHDGRVISVSSDMLEYKKLLGLSLKFKTKIAQPVMFKDKVDEDLASYHFQSNHDLSLSEVTSHWWTSIWKFFLRISLFITIPLAIVGIIILLIVFKKKRGSTNTVVKYYNPVRNQTSTC